MKVEIKNGKAVELNRLGERPHPDDYTDSKGYYLSDIEDWYKAEAARKVYEIDLSCKCGWSGKENELDEYTFEDDRVSVFYCPQCEEEFKNWPKENSIHEAELINETIVRIL